MAKAGFIPANLRPFVETLGEEAARRLFIDLGGSTVILSRIPRENSLITKTLDRDQNSALVKKIGIGNVKIPLARKWIADSMSRSGASTAEIARTVRADEETVRRWLKGEQRKGALPSPQLQLFD